MIGLLSVLMFAIYVLRSLRIAKKQKEVIEFQKVMVEEKQLQIIDSIKYARRIQLSLLPTEKYIEKNMNRMRRNEQ